MAFAVFMWELKEAVKYVARKDRGARFAPRFFRPANFLSLLRRLAARLEAALFQYGLAEGVFSAACQISDVFGVAVFDLFNGAFIRDFRHQCF